MDFPLEKYLFSSSDPHPYTLFWHSFWHSIWKYLWHKYSDILSGISSAILSGIYSDIFSSILSDIYSDILAPILTSCLTPILTFFPEYIIWHLLGHSFWHPFWHSFWHLPTLIEQPLPSALHEVHWTSACMMLCGPILCQHTSESWSPPALKVQLCVLSCGYRNTGLWLKTENKGALGSCIYSNVYAVFKTSLGRQKPSASQTADRTRNRRVRNRTGEGEGDGTGPARHSSNLFLGGGFGRGLHPLIINWLFMRDNIFSVVHKRKPRFNHGSPPCGSQRWPWKSSWWKLHWHC